MLVRLPLFPLGRALFPGQVLRLQIFEQRYLRMVRECLGGTSRFGVVGLHAGSETQADVQFVDFGCLADMVDWDALDNGLLGIRVRGSQRFRIIESSMDDDGLWFAAVELLEDIRASAGATDFSGLTDLLVALSENRPLEVPRPLDAAALGWCLASALPLSAQQSEWLLAENDVVERLEWLSDYVYQLANR